MSDAVREANAIIKSARFYTERGLSAFIDLECGEQQVYPFGGYLLYAEWQKANLCGLFISRVFEIAQVSDWQRLPGRAVRVRIEEERAVAIGHIINEDWFDPRVDFVAAAAIAQGQGAKA